MTTVPSPTASHDEPTSNERFKQSFSSRVWLSMIVATMLHVVIFAAWPTMQVEVLASDGTPLEVFQPPDTPLPDQPENPPRPAPPAPGDVDTPDDATMPQTDWENFVPDELAPPPPVSETRKRGALPFTPHTVKPELRNTDAVLKSLAREYPGILKDAGIGGVVVLHVHIDTQGEVIEARIGEPSPHASLNAAALTVAEVMSFRPALNLDSTVAVWIALPITFRSRR